MLAEVPLDSPPKELDKVKFTVELGEQNAQMTGFLDYLLNERFLCEKIRLVFHNSAATTGRYAWFAFLTLPSQSFRLFICV